MRVSVETKIYCRSGGALPPVDVEPGVTITRATDGALAKAVSELRFILDASRPSNGRDRLREHLDHAVQLVTVRRQADEVEPSEVERTIATALDGVIEAPEPGRSNRFFDPKLRRFYRL